MNDKDFYEMQDFLLGGVQCDTDNRRKCDSLYIDKYNRLEKRCKKVLELMDKYCSDEYLIIEVKRKLTNLEDKD